MRTRLARTGGAKTWRTGRSHARSAYTNNDKAYGRSVERERVEKSQWGPDAAARSAYISQWAGVCPDIRHGRRSAYTSKERAPHRASLHACRIPSTHRVACSFRTRFSPVSTRARCLFIDQFLVASPPRASSPVSPPPTASSVDRPAHHSPPPPPTTTTAIPYSSVFLDPLRTLPVSPLLSSHPHARLSHCAAAFACAGAPATLWSVQ